MLEYGIQNRSRITSTAWLMHVDAMQREWFFRYAVSERDVQLIYKKVMATWALFAVALPR